MPAAFEGLKGSKFKSSRVQSERSERIDCVELKVGYAELKVRANSCYSWLTFEWLWRF